MISPPRSPELLGNRRSLLLATSTGGWTTWTADTGFANNRDARSRSDLFAAVVTLQEHRHHTAISFRTGRFSAQLTRILHMCICTASTAHTRRASDGHRMQTAREQSPHDVLDIATHTKLTFETENAPLETSPAVSNHPTACRTWELPSTVPYTDRFDNLVPTVSPALTRRARIGR